MWYPQNGSIAMGSRRVTPTAPVAAAVVSDAMVAPTNTPCCQLNDSYTSGASRARRPPKINAEIGTPPGSSQRGEIDARLFGRHRVPRVGLRAGAIGSADHLAALPVHQARRALFRPCLPTTARATGVMAVFVKIVLLRSRRHDVRIRLAIRAGRDAKKSRLGIDRVQVPIRPDCHPGDIVAHRPHPVAAAFERRHHHGQVGFAARARKRRRHVRHFSRTDLRVRESACARPSSPARAPSSSQFAAQNISCPAARCRRSPSQYSRSVFLRGNA